MPTQERQTAQKTLIREALGEHDRFISAQQLHGELEASGRAVGLATVYRQLNALADSGQADTVVVDGESLYKTCATDAHHHHLICEVCGRSQDLDPPSEAWIARIARTHGFTVNRHVLEVYGTCAECSARG